MIKIKKNKNCDTRTCDFSKVSKKELLENSKLHIEDVKKGLLFLKDMMIDAAANHDHMKIRDIDLFYDDFKTGFKTTDWWEAHQDQERHHLQNDVFIQEDVNLIDILEMIVDGVMAGLARTGEYRKEEIPDGLLRKAFDNTIELMLSNVEAVE